MEEHKECLTEKEVDYLTKFDWQSSNFYVLPKIHKSSTITNKVKESNSDYIELPPPDDLKARPIVAGCNAPTQRLSALLEKLLQPISQKVKTYIKDDWHFLRNVPQNLCFNDVTLYSVDISSLYTSINHDLAIKAITYWIRKHKNLIPDRFTEIFILKSLRFVLENNNFIFDDVYYHQNEGTAMGTKAAPPMACLTVAYLEEVKLFPEILPKHFNQSQCSWIENTLKRYMDDGFVPLLKSIDMVIFLSCLNAMDTSINFTEERAELLKINDVNTQRLNFLDVTLLLNEKNEMHTDIYYKTTNSHDYLDFFSSHPYHTKANIPYNLAKRIICFVSQPERMEYRLNELRSYLKKCNYPESIIEKGIFNARLQGPAPERLDNKIIPFVTTHFENISVDSVIRKTRFLLQNTTSNELHEKFKSCNFIQSERQPKNLLRLLSTAKFSTSESRNPTENFISKCRDSRCNICKMYMQFVDEFPTATGKMWKIKSPMSCNSKNKNVIYYLKCNRCDQTTYIGKTINIRSRTNQHISSCRTGKGTDIFDQHVFSCNTKPHKEPYFKLYLMMTSDEHSLLTYESHFHRLRYDTMNRR